MSAWPKGVVAGEACPHGAGTDQVRMEDTQTCTVPGTVRSMCPCRAVLSGWEDAWIGFAAPDGGVAERERQAALLRTPREAHSDHLHGDGDIA